MRNAPHLLCVGTTDKVEIRRVLQQLQPEQLEQIGEFAFQAAAQGRRSMKREPLDDDPMGPAPSHISSIAQDRGDSSSNSEESTVEVITSNEIRERKRKRVQSTPKQTLPPSGLQEVSTLHLKSLVIVPI